MVDSYDACSKSIESRDDKEVGKVKLRVLGEELKDIIESMDVKKEQIKILRDILTKNVDGYEAKMMNREAGSKNATRQLEQANHHLKKERGLQQTLASLALLKTSKKVKEMLMQSN